MHLTEVAPVTQIRPLRPVAAAVQTSSAVFVKTAELQTQFVDITDTKQRKLLPIIENYFNNREQTMQATLTSRREHNFRVDNRKENQLYL